MLEQFLVYPCILLSLFYFLLSDLKEKQYLVTTMILFSIVEYRYHRKDLYRLLRMVIQAPVRQICLWYGT